MGYLFSKDKITSRAVHELRRGNFAQALELSGQALGNNNQDFWAAFCGCVAAGYLDDRQAFVAYLSELERIEDDSPYLAYLQAYLSLWLSDTEKALWYWTRIVEMSEGWLAKELVSLSRNSRRLLKKAQTGNISDFILFPEFFSTLDDGYSSTDFGKGLQIDFISDDNNTQEKIAEKKNENNAKEKKTLNNAESFLQEDKQSNEEEAIFKAASHQEFQKQEENNPEQNIQINKEESYEYQKKDQGERARKQTEEQEKEQAKEKKIISKRHFKRDIRDDFSPISNGPGIRYVREHSKRKKNFLYYVWYGWFMDEKKKSLKLPSYLFIAFVAVAFAFLFYDSVLQKIFLVKKTDVQREDVYSEIQNLQIGEWANVLSKNKNVEYKYENREQLVQDFDKAKNIIREGKINQSRYLLQRIMLSNADFKSKEKSRIFLDFIPDVSYQDFHDPVSLENISKEPQFYANSIVLLEGKIIKEEDVNNGKILSALVTENKQDYLVDAFLPIEIKEKNWLPYEDFEKKQNENKGKQAILFGKFKGLIGKQNKIYLQLNKIWY